MKLSKCRVEDAAEMEEAGGSERLTVGLFLLGVRTGEMLG